MSNTIDNTQDIIDSRDIIARIEGLETELADAHEGDGTTDKPELEDWIEQASKSEAAAFHEEAKELLILRKVAEEASTSADWEYGETLIRESYFEDYIEELIEDCYEMPKQMGSGEWPYRHLTLDIEAAAEEAKQDYMEVDFDGVTYLIRA